MKKNEETHPEVVENQNEMNELDNDTADEPMDEYE